MGGLQVRWGQRADAAQPSMGLRVTKRRFRERIQADFDEACRAGIRYQLECYASGEPQTIMRSFIDRRARRPELRPALRHARTARGERPCFTSVASGAWGRLPGNRRFAIGRDAFQPGCIARCSPLARRQAIVLRISNHREPRSRNGRSPAPRIDLHQRIRVFVHWRPRHLALRVDTSTPAG